MNVIIGQHEAILEIFIFKYISEWELKTKTNKKREQRSEGRLSIKKENYEEHDPLLPPKKDRRKIKETKNRKECVKT